MLRLFKKSNRVATKLYEVTFRIKPLEGSDMPRDFIGALVPCYVPASDHLEATKLAFQHLSKKYDVVEVIGEVKQIDVSKWSSYVRQVWSDFPDHFPNQIEFERKVEAKLVVVGPFLGYEER